MDILNSIIDKDKKDFKCYNELVELLKVDSDFKDKVERGIALGKIQKFSEELWDKIRKQNIRVIDSFEDVFRDGANIGYCTVASKQLSYSFDDCFICGGTLPILAGSKNCPDGRHTWIWSKGHIIDTTLMLVIEDNYAKELGYIEENRYNPNQDAIYLAAKEWTNDKNIQGGRRR